MGLEFLVSESDRRNIGSSALETLQAVYSEYLKPANLQVELALIDMPAMRALNASTRNINEPTDVLSFPLFENRESIKSLPTGTPTLIGSIVICPEKALLYQETLPQLVHHGMLHICGFDHETDIIAWREQESRLLSNLSQSGLSIPGIPQ